MRSDQRAWIPRAALVLLLLFLAAIPALAHPQVGKAAGFVSGVDGIRSPGWITRSP